MKHIRAICFSLALLMLLSSQAMAADYSFETAAATDYYGSTSYEEVYGAQYNYGGQNAVDFLDPLADGAPTTALGSSITYGVTSGSGSVSYGITSSTSSTYADSTGSGFPVLWDAQSTSQATQFTAASEVSNADGSIGTLIIPSLGIKYKVYDGTSSSSMSKGVGHFPSTSAWSGNIGICGHNRGSRYNIGAVKDMSIGDTIQYKTSKGTKTYAVSYVGIIDWTDWSYLNSTADNRVTIITCLADQPEKRICVVATEVRS